jgi:hypothetical protein
MKAKTGPSARSAVGHADQVRSDGPISRLAASALLEVAGVKVRKAEARVLEANPASAGIGPSVGAVPASSGNGVRLRRLCRK